MGAEYSAQGLPEKPSSLASTQSTTPNKQKGKIQTSMKQKIINYIRAGYPGLYLVSHEEQRVALEMTRIAHELK
jgi:hypothetical protein